VNYVDLNGNSSYNISQLKNESWLFKLASRLNPNFTLDKKFYIANFNRFGIQLSMYITMSYNTNKLGLVNINNDSISVSFLGISLGVGWGGASMSIYRNILKYDISAIQRIGWTKSTKAVSISFIAKCGLAVALVLSLSMNHLTTLAVSLIACAVVISLPYIGPYLAMISGFLASASSLLYGLKGAFGY
jgi:hypothetical protein